MYHYCYFVGDKYVSMFNEECNKIIKYLLKQREDTFDAVSSKYTVTFVVVHV